MMRYGGRGWRIGALLLITAGCSGEAPSATAADAGGGGGASADADAHAGADSGACTDGETQPCYGGPAGTEGVGLCKAGLETCAGGAFGACVGAITPEDEVCDGLDNDCDGVPDNGDPGGSVACSTGLLGVCAAGTTACVAGSLVCNQTTASTAEVCDGLDNDCDGVPDNGDPGTGDACATGLLGVCAAGTAACIAGNLVCNQTVVSTAEVCDGLDNDCDGVPDDGVCAPGGALHFDGIDDRVAAPLPAVFDAFGASDFTIEAWIYPTSSAFTRILFAQKDSANFTSLSRNSPGTIYFYVVKGGTVSSLSTNAAAPLDRWTHVAATYVAASSSLAIYFDGVEQPTGAGGESSSGTNGMAIGSRTGGAQFFAGMIDEVRIWNVARPGCEIVAASACEVPANAPGLVALYRFDQGVLGGANPAVTQLLDSSPAANHGTLTNFALSGATSNWVAAGGGVGGGLTDVMCDAPNCEP